MRVWDAVLGICDKVGDCVSVAVMGIGAGVGWFFGGWDLSLVILAVLIGIDFVTGVVTAWVNQELDSQKAARGVVKKVFMFLVVGVANLADILTGNHDAIRMAAIFLYIWTEMVSITENAARAGVPLPEKLIAALKVIKGMEGVNNAQGDVQKSIRDK